jgi:Uma2 family endonuclease
VSTQITQFPAAKDHERTHSRAFSQTPRRCRFEAGCCRIKRETFKEPEMSISRASALTTRAATLDDLAKVDGKAELIAGRIVRQMPTGHLPSRVAFRIASSLDQHSDAIGHGVAYSDNIGYAIPKLPSGRESFSPDASYYTGPAPTNPMRFVPGSPTFAVEVRSENDYGDAALEAMAAKRADYFQAGTLVVWDVDPLGRAVLKYRADAPDQPTRFVQGDEADAEPAVPGWRMPVDQMFL